jgi:hypothetical protein
VNYLCVCLHQGTVVSPQSEQFLKVTGFRGGGRAVIQNVTHKANIVGSQSERFAFRTIPQSDGFSRRRTHCHTKCDP